MRQRGFICLLLMTVAVAAAAIVVAARGDRTVNPPPPGGPALPGLSAKLGDLTWMRLTRGAMTADFTAIVGQWAVVEKSNYPANPKAVRKLLLGLAGLTLVEPKTNRPDRLARLDLDDPKAGRSTLVALQDRSGAVVAQLIVGKSRPDLLGGGNDGVYVRKPGDSQAWLARGSLELADSVTGWLDRRILDLAAARIAAVTLTPPDGSVLTLRRDAGSGKFVVVNLPAEAKLKDDESAASPAEVLARLDLDDVKPAIELPPPASGVTSAVFTTTDGLTVTLRLFSRDATDWITVAAAAGDTTEAAAKAINDKLGRWAYAIPAERAKLLRTTLADLVAPPKGS